MSPKAAQPKLIVLSAPSGTGKSTLSKMLLERHPHSLALSISHTTRAPRGEEQNGKEYYFVSETEFKKMISENKFLEYAHVFSKNYYGTSKKVVDDILAKGSSVLFDIDVEGAANLKKIYKNQCLTLFIHPPSFEELERRLKSRKTDSEESIRARLETAKKEIAVAPTFDHQFVNDVLEDTYQKIEALLRQEHAI